jgi:type 1 glutamine amidotransferase
MSRFALARPALQSMLLALACLLFVSLQATAQPVRFHVLALAEHGGLHQPFVDAAKLWLTQEGAADGFDVEYIENTDRIDDQFLSRFRLVLQLNYPPYGWPPTAAAAFQRYIEQGRGGWIGFHHATLLGEFDGYPMWPWFHRFMGAIRWKDYIPQFATGTVKLEDTSHPILQGLPAQFTIENEEWYTYDRSPRPNVHVLASVDESTYTPHSSVTMGDHPVIWTNDRMKARNVYIFMGHHAELFSNPAFTRIFHNAILWAAQS